MKGKKTIPAGMHPEKDNSNFKPQKKTGYEKSIITQLRNNVYCTSFI